jgi:hypothetical protein
MVGQGMPSPRLPGGASINRKLLWKPARKPISPPPSRQSQLSRTEAENGSNYDPIRYINQEDIERELAKVMEKCRGEAGSGG